MLPRQIEIEGCKNIKCEDRNFKLCNEGVETENHFVFLYYILKKENCLNLFLVSKYSNWCSLDVQDYLNILMKRENYVSLMKYLIINSS